MEQKIPKGLKIILWISIFLSGALIIGANLLLHDAPDYYVFIVWISLPSILVGSILLIRSKLAGVWLYSFGAIPVTILFIYLIVQALITPCDPTSIWSCTSFLEGVFQSPGLWGSVFLVPSFLLISLIYLWSKLGIFRKS